MATPGSPPTNPPLGYVTETQLRNISEFANSFVNRAGIPDDKDQLGTRANASWPRMMLEFMVQINEILAGRTLVPGIASVAGKSWRQGDDGSAALEAADLTFYGIETPTLLYSANGNGGTPEIGATFIAGTYFNFDIVNARGGVNGEARLVYALRSLYDKIYRTAASFPGLGANFAFCAFFNLSHWNQANDGIVLASYRAYDRADETGSSYRLGFEIGLGRPYTRPDTTVETGQGLTLYYRHVGSNDVEVIKFLDIGGPFSVSFPFGREVCIGFIRGATSVQIYVNGLLAYTGGYSSVGQDPSPGTAPEMRLILGGDWDKSKYFNGSVRNVAAWTTSFPDAGQMLAYYRVGAGFSPKAPA